MTIAFNLSQLANYVNSSGKLDAANGLVNATPVANGGTGAATATAYAVQCGGTTSTGAHQSIASVGTAGQVLTSNGAGALPTFQSSNAGQIAYALYTSGTSTWTCPATVTKVFVIVIGGGGGATGTDPSGTGGVAIGIYTVVPLTSYSYVVGAGGAGSVAGIGAVGGTSTFGSFCSATGGQSYPTVSGTGVGSGGTLTNYHALENTAGIFMGIPATSSVSPAAWTVASGSVPGSGASGSPSGNSGLNGIVYIQYIG
jgi:hypothetical protein